MLLDNEQIRAFLNDKKRVLEVIGYKRKEELNRKGGVAADMQIANFDYFRGLDGIDKPNEEKKMVWEFPIEFQEAKSYRTEVNSLLRPTQWQDLLVRVYV